MLKLFKHVSFWLTFFALCICLFNLLGFDDKNLLLYFTSPLLWILGDYISFLNRFLSQQLIMLLFYFITLYFWCCVGMIADLFIHRTKRKKILNYLLRIGIATCIVTLISIYVYSIQNSEKQMSTILNNPDKFNQQSLQSAVLKSAKEGYGEQYIEEIKTILQNSNNKEVYGSTLYALGLIGTPEAIRILVEHYHEPVDIIYSLQSNEHTIITMLDSNQPQPIISAGIDAAKLLEFGSFIPALNILANEYEDDEIQQRAQEVMQQIHQNPKTNNPKFNNH